MTEAARSSAEGRELLEQLMEGHERFLRGEGTPKRYLTLATLNEVRKKVATVLSCSDSRVSPELVFDQTFGDLFVIRTAGQTVSPVAIGSIEFAVEMVNSPLLLIMGHEDCRAVAAAMSEEVVGTDSIQAIVEVIRPTVAGETDLSVAVHRHIRETADRLLRHSTILRERVQSGSLLLATAFYHVSSGRVELLD